MSKIADIAKAVGVSTATVSRAFNHHPYVDEALRNKIIEIGLRMGYAPTISSSRRNFGIMFGRFKFSYYERQLLYHLTDGILSQGYNIQIVNTAQVQLAHKNTYRGMFLLSDFSENDFSALKKLNIPILFVNFARSGFYSVSTDHKLSMEIAMTHLIKRGHEKIAFLRAHENHWGSNLREIGYKETLIKYNIPFVPKLVSYFNDRDDIMKKVINLLKYKPTALIVDGEGNAAPVNSALIRAGVKVPEELSVVCFEDEEYTRYTTPPYTAIKQDFSALGHVAASIMLQLISTSKAGKIPLNSVIPGNTIISRDSVMTINPIKEA